MIRNLSFFKPLAGFASVGVLMALASTAQATAFTSSIDFANATTSLTIENYGSTTAGTLIADGDTLDGLTYSFSTASGRGGVITNLYDSFTGNSLAAKQTAGPLVAADFFYPNESFTVTFAAPVTAVGIFSNTNLPVDASVTTASGTAVTTFTTYDTSTFGFLGFTSKTPFTSVTFASSTFNIPEIEFGAAAVPEMSTWAMMLAGFGLVGVALRNRPRVRSQRPTLDLA